MILPAYKTKIVCTIGPASGSKAVLERLILQGMNVARMYFRTGAGSENARVEDIISLNAVESANALNVRYILTGRQSRNAAGLISRFKPDCWILPCGGDEKTNNFLVLSYGVFPVCPDYKTDIFTDMAMRFLAGAGMVEENEKVILLDNEPTRDMHTDSLKIISA